MGSHLDNYKKLNEWITKPLSLKLKKIKEKKFSHNLTLWKKNFSSFSMAYGHFFFFLNFLGITLIPGKLHTKGDW